MEWYESKRQLPNDGERVLGIRPSAHQKSYRLYPYTFEIIQEGAFTGLYFTDSDGNSYDYDDVKYWTPIDNIPNGVDV